MQDLAGRGLLVGQQQLAVDRLVLLTVRRVDLRRREDRVQTEGARLVGDDRHEPLADLLVLHQVLEQAYRGHGGGHLLLARPGTQLLVGGVGRQRERLAPHAAPGYGAAQRGTPLLHVLDLVGLLARVVVRRQVGLQRRVGDRQVEPVAERLEVGLGELLHLVRGVAALERLQRPALDRLGEDHRRLAHVGARRGERGVHLAVVVPAARKAAQVVVGPVLDHAPQPRVAAEEVLADVRAGLHRVGLVLPVGGLVHLVDQHPVTVTGQQRVPVPAPDHLDDVPAGSAEVRLELLDDLAVAADGAVEALQVAVDDEGEVVQLLAGGHPDRAEGLHLVHLAVAEERPDVRVGRVGQAAGLQVSVEPRLVDRADRAQPHRHGRELPELRHQPRVRVGGQPHRRARLLLPEPVQVCLGEPALQEGARVDAGRRVPLEVDLVARCRPAVRIGVVLAAEEVVVAHLVQRRGRGVGGDVAAHADGLVHARDHDRRVPADVGADAPLDVLVAGEPRLPLGRDGVDVVAAAQGGHADLALARALEQLEHEEPGTLTAVGVDRGVEGFDPLTGLVRVDVGQLAGQAVGDDIETVTGHPNSEHPGTSLRSGADLLRGNATCRAVTRSRGCCS